MKLQTSLHPTLRPSSLIIAGILFFILFGCSRSTSNEQATTSEITVAAASDLAPAFEELGVKFEQATRIKVIFSFGSTGTLARQIENGAPFDLFAAANVEYVDGLDRKALIIPETKTLYARGRITIWTNPSNPLIIDRLEDLTRPEVERIAIANPEHAPYGAAAREALRSAGIWDAVKPKLVLGENIRQTMQYAETGNVEVAIVALSLSIKSKGRWTLIPQEMHKPLDQALAVIKGAKNEEGARQFATFINSVEGRPVMRQYGFVLPDEEPLR